MHPAHLHAAPAREPDRTQERIAMRPGQRRTAPVIVAAVVTLGLLAGCGGGDAADSQESGKATIQPVVCAASAVTCK